MHIYIHTYICMAAAAWGEVLPPDLLFIVYVYANTYIHVYIYIERERE